MTRMKHCGWCGAALIERAVADGTRRVCSVECGYVFYDNPLPVVAAIVEQDEHVILVAQHGWPESWFGLVTGFLEKGESPEAGVLRELHEELGLEGTVASLVGAYTFEQRNELIVAYHVLARGEPTLGPELRGFKRVAISKLKPWPFGTGHAVRDWLARRAS